jgi:hypothetical protein
VAQPVKILFAGAKHSQEPYHRSLSSTHLPTIFQQMPWQICVLVDSASPTQNSVSLRNFSELSQNRVQWRGVVAVVLKLRDLLPES